MVDRTADVGLRVPGSLFVAHTMFSLPSFVSLTSLSPRTTLSPAGNQAGSWEKVGYLVLLALPYALAALAVMRPGVDWDLWWHLGTGQWVVEHRTVPIVDPFAAPGRAQPWVAYSWLFEILVYLLYQISGLYSVLIYRASLSFAVLIALHFLLARQQRRLLPALGLFLVAEMALLPLLSERPWLFTILFTTWTLVAMLDLRAGRSSPGVWLLPLVFVVWANVHIQFVYGLLVLVLACAAPLFDRLLGREDRGNSAAVFGSPAWWRLLVLSAACAAATLVNPYHIRLYGVVCEYAFQPLPYEVVAELNALTFRGLSDWLVLGLSLGAAFVLGRRNRVSSWDVLLLGAAAYFSFRTRRNLWFVTLAAVTILSVPPGTIPQTAAEYPLTRRRLVVLATLVAGVLLLTATVRRLTPETLERAVAETFPVQAVAVIEKRACTGPLYNHFNWGGFLIWNLPRLPVAIDGRTNLHGDERLARHQRTWNGQKDWDEDPDLKAANLVIAGPDQALASLLRLDPNFATIHEDDVAVVFVRRVPAAR